MATIYQSAEIMIYPSIFEGFGITIIESLFSNTPVITSNVGCFQETGGEGAIYINPMSTSELTNAINLIQNNSKLKKKMIEKGHEHIKKFTDNKISKNLFNLYKSL